MITTLRRIARVLLWTAALLFVAQVVVAFVGPPRALTDWLVGAGEQPREAPRYVVVLGGGGIPSESGLLRTYYAADYGRTLTNATFIVSLPADDSPATSSVGRMRDELVMRGIPSSSIQMETRGLNTHQQADKIREMLGADALTQSVVLVTSGYHMRRSLLSFRKEGFAKVAGLTAEGIGAEADPGALAWLRYTIWHNLEREAQILRELVALTAYKLRGWI